jgi:hypothetical protein
MMSRCLSMLIVTAVSFLAVQDAAAQRITVQQPVIENFSVATTVSVPDRGSALLGGVGSARSSRSQYGPFPSVSAIGLERQASTASVHAYIHDFEEMDAALLSAGPPSTSKLDPRIARRLREHGPSSERPVNDVLKAIDIAAEAERLAEQAEARGKPGVAKLHWQRAAKHGSTRAAQRLAETVASRPSK